MLDALRGIFIYVVAALFPLAGVILAVIRLTEGDRNEALMLLAAAFLGLCVYALLFA